MKKTMGRKALSSVRDRNFKPDTEHRVPTGQRPCASWDSFTVSDGLHPVSHLLIVVHTLFEYNLAA